MSFKEYGNNPFKMSEVISDCMVSPSVSILIRLEDIPEIDTEESKISTMTLLSNGFDGTGDRDDRRLGSTQLPSENKLLPKQRPLRLPLPPSSRHQLVTSAFNPLPLSPAFSETSGQSLLSEISRISELSKLPHEDGDDYRLEKSDFIRQELRKPVVPINEIHTLENLIDDLLHEGPSLEFEVIAHARLDKIVEEILQHVRNNFLSHGPSFRQIMRKVQKLREQWIETFGERYHAMDEERLKVMKKDGCLRDLDLQTTGEVSKVDGPMWKIRRVETFSEKEANENFEPGAWFLNTHCAVRDGIVSDAKDGFIWGGNRKPVAFSMLSGFEIKGIGRREWIHIIESRVCAYHAVRLTCVGSVVRLLRGHKLKSERAPRLGVRYDGLYKVESWGQVLLKLSSGPDIYRNTVTLVELAGQNTMEELDVVPTPWQMDDFVIYNRMIENEIKAREGEAAYKEHRSSESKKETARKVFISKLKAYDQPAYKLLDDSTHRLENAFPLPLSFEPYPASPPRDTTRNR
ncbi:48f01998-36fc-4981-bc1a-a3c0320bcd77 [Sclerotinia trifoliorum]|uniref:48f01998-36fc-4981-bc1a-a3c0320bcd77 n=1 Tax=Sclerotinia trifoliorum TaxID=28548 RepID=A0A8H2VKU6_9HELO|nr:48f01998-36fc-4981-bc1a-a3c0320bcd77 [Sclerotinia trifoliorum]